MEKDFGKLSPDQIKKLAGVISDAKSLTSQQAEIIEQVLAGEIDINRLRIANLKGYFDIYSRNLDLIARRYSDLNDAFLILDRQLTESYKKNTPEHKKPLTKDETSGTKKAKSDGSESPTDKAADQPSAEKDKGRDVYSTLQAEKLEELNNFTTEELQQKADALTRFFQKNEEERRNIIISEKAYLDAIEEKRQERKIEQLKRHAKQVEDIENKIIDVELLRHQTEEDRQNQINGIRLNKLQQSLEAEYNAQELINSITAELAYASGIMDADSTTQATTDKQQAQEAEGPESRIKTVVAIAESEATSTIEKKSTDTTRQRAGEANTNKVGTDADFDTHSIGKNGQEITEAGALSARKADAEARLKAAKAFEDSISKYREKKQLEARRKNNGILKKEEASAIEKEIAKRFTLEKLNDKKRIEALAKLEAEQLRKKEQEEFKKGVSALTENGKTFSERKQQWQELTQDGDGKTDPAKAISAVIVSVSDLATKLEKKIDEIASYKGFIDTRLQGSSNEKYAGSYWDQLVRDITSVGAINPYFKQETFANNIKDLVNQGIAFDLKQRAFLMTIQEKIANTFDVADGTLLRLVRIQQEDSTAGRLGMESALNTFLNNMYETSEYLSKVADSVRGSLEEMQSLMTGAEAAEVEYQIQKWLGSLYSVGMSQNAVQSISDALGKMAAGQIEGITNGGAGNLLIMAANDAGLSIADILTSGINSSDTNKLLQAAVNYLAELSDSAKDNKVVQQQLADVFGVKASDLRAATNLVIPGTTKNIYNNNLQYDDMLSQLSAMAGSMGKRTSIAEMMTNFWENGQYTLAGGMASNPVSYFIYKMAKVVDDAAGGIDLPFINVMGYGVDLNTTVSDLMRIAAVGTGILGSIGPLISGLGSSFSGISMLNKLGIGTGSGLAVTPRGSGANLLGFANEGGSTTSESGYVGNASGSDIKNSTIQEANDSKKQQMIEAKEEEEANKVDILNDTVIKMYELLEDVANGDRSFRVKVDSYGLTKPSNGGSGSLGGVGALGGSSGGGSSAGGGTAGSGSTGSGSGVNSSGMGGSVDLGSWTAF